MSTEDSVRVGSGDGSCEKDGQGPSKGPEGGENKQDQGPKGKVFTKEDIKDHKTCKSLWLIIDNKVYDVTEFMDEHPGGEEVLLDLGGTDATEPFDDVSHSTDAREMMEKYYIGELHDDDKTKKTKPPISTVTEPCSQSSWSNWFVPLGLAIAAALLYRYMMVSKDMS